MKISYFDPTLKSLCTHALYTSLHRASDFAACFNREGSMVNLERFADANE